jgi:hypothetical protein
MAAGADAVGERHAVTPSALAEAVKLATGLVLGVSIYCFVCGFALAVKHPLRFGFSLGFGV